MAYTKTGPPMANLNQGNCPAARRLIILGASARAAAFSAVRAGFLPTACDLFGDEDLRQVALFERLPGTYPHGFLEALESMPGAPFLYTGRLENDPRLVDRLARLRPLWGNPGAALRRSRDPFLFSSVMAEAGAAPPAMRRGEDPPDSDLDQWLRKPLRSGGGAKIARASHAPPRQGKRLAFYYQRLASGDSHSSIHVAERAGSRLLGVTRQLVGVPWLHAPAFTWCGSIGPVLLPPPVTAVLERAGNAAARTFGLRGLFGIDFLLDGTRLQPVELNPRYPASTEILEHGLGIAAIRLHAAACAGEDAVPEPPPVDARGGILGKAVVFAPHDLVVASRRVEPGAIDPHRFPVLADVPAPGATIPAGRPIITVFAQGATMEKCEAALRQAARRF